MDYDSILRTRIAALKDEGRYRIFANLERQAKKFPQALCHGPGGIREVTVWCSNDYLGMSQHPAVCDAMIKAVNDSGGGAGGTRNISGTNNHHVRLESELADLYGKQAALIFTSGYIANEAALSTLPRLLPDCVVFSDEANHNSMIVGIRHSGAKKHVFRHNDVDHLDELLSGYPRDQAKLVAFESVYSMDGDIAPMAEICDVARRHNALTYLDEVHAVGLYGARGSGIAERDGVMEHIDIFQGTLGKGIGVMGGYIAGSASIVDAVRSFAASFIFTTALPPVLAAGAVASLHHLKTATHMRTHHQERAATLKRRLAEAGLPVMPSASHIVPVLVGDAAHCKAVSDALLHDYAIYVQPINYPTVPRGLERLRLTPTPFHDDCQMERLVQALREIWDRFALGHAA